MYAFSLISYELSLFNADKKIPFHARFNENNIYVLQNLYKNVML